MPYDWQAEAMLAVEMHKHVSVVAANGSGKTDRLVAPLILWFLDQNRLGRVIFTSGSYRQLIGQLIPAVKKHRRRFPDWEFLAEEIRTPEGGRGIGFSVTDEGRSEGWHSSPDSPVFIIVDECKTVKDGVIESFDRCTRDYQLWVSSAGSPRGQFYDSFHKNRSLYWTRKVPSTECPHIPAERRERDIIKYGASHPLFRSKHLAEFTEDSDRLIITAEQLAAVLQPPENTNGETVAFCDFAAGRDENVLAIRRGNVARIVKAWTEKDTVQGARQFIALFHEHGIKPHMIWGDADGLGKGFVDALAEAGWRINKFYGGQAAMESDDFVSLISETWHTGCTEIKAGRVNIGVLDPTTFTQLTTRQWEWGDKSKLRIEDKEKMRANGISSPDRADALLGCIMCGSRLTGSLSASSIALPPSGSFGGGIVTGW